nr:adherens junction-associated protein 1-like [Microcebus murinus]
MALALHSQDAEGKAAPLVYAVPAAGVETWPGPGPCLALTVFSPPCSSMSTPWPGCSLGSHAWILIAMFQLAVDFPACESLGPGPEFRLLPRPSPRPPRLWSFKSGQPARAPAPVWSPRPPRVERIHGQMQTPRAKRAHRPRDQVAALVPKAGLSKPPAAAKSSPSLASPSSSSPPVAGGATEQQALLRRGRRHLQGDGLGGFDFRGGRPTTEAEFIAWGPTGDEEGLESNTFPGVYGPTTVSVLQTRKTTVAATTTTTTATPTTLQTKGLTESLDPRRRIPVGASTTEPSTSPSGDGQSVKPPRILGETSGTATSFLVGVCLGLGAGGLAGGCRDAPGATLHMEARSEAGVMCAWTCTCMRALCWQAQAVPGAGRASLGVHVEVAGAVPTTGDRPSPPGTGLRLPALQNIACRGGPGARCGQVSWWR